MKDLNLAGLSDSDPRAAAKGFRSMDTVWVSGTLKAAKSDTAMGASGYRLDAVVVEAYVDKPKWRAITLAPDHSIS